MPPSVVEVRPLTTRSRLPKLLMNVAGSASAVAVFADGERRLGVGEARSAHRQCVQI